MSATTALQRTLAAEHAAIHLLGSLGGATSASTESTLHALVTAQHRIHRARREYLTAVLRGLGIVPVVAETAYLLPDDLASTTVARSTGLETERRCAQTYSVLVSESTDDVRTWAIAALGESAVALTQWGAALEPFPGAPEL